MKNLIVSAAVVAVATSAASAQQAVQWRVEDGGNGHWYQFREMSSSSWIAHLDASRAIGGHLATLTSSAENSFVEALLPTVVPGGGQGYLYGPSIGLYQPPGNSEPSGGWRWVTDEALSFSQWFPGEPNDFASDGEHWARMRFSGSTFGWNDTVEALPSSDLPFHPLVTSAIIEWSADCNNDGIVDYGQILSGQLADSDSNGVPEVCEYAGTTFTFSASDDGWSNQATEPFDVYFIPDGGVGGGGALRVSGDARNSFQLVHAWSTDWPAEAGAFSLITIDFRGISLAGDLSLSSTGVKIRHPAGTESTAYLADRLVSFGGGWSRIEFKPTCLLDLPASHNDVGLNIHFGFTGYLSNTFHIDNVIGVSTQDIRFTDDNSNGIPDECEAPPCPADVVLDGMINATDLALVLSQWGTAGGSPSADVDGDGLVEGKDLAVVISGWGRCQ
jgi:hypothetical protein